MATHDYAIANASGAAVRADLNNALAAIVTNNSNATEPATTYAYQWWADTTAGQLKLRNAANNGWVVIQELDGTMLMENGTAAAPGLAFAGDLDTGFFWPEANHLAAATNGTENFRITHAGVAQFGDTLHLRNPARTVVTNIIGYDPSPQTLAVINRGNAGTGAYQGVGLGVAATSWGTYSDERGKTNLAPIENGLTKIASLRAVTGRYNEDEENASRSFLIAQDVQQVLPEAVDNSDPERLSLRYAEVIPLLVAALKESKERIETLEAKVAALEAA